MIEFCTKRRMVLSIIALGVLTIVILILEETLTSDLGPNGSGTHLQNGSYFSTAAHSSFNSLKSSSEKLPVPVPARLNQDNTEPCWLTEEFRIEKQCSACTKFEVSSGVPSACVETGRKETIRCFNSGVVYRSCSQIVELEKRHFWVFESLMLLVTILGFGAVKLRWSQLERNTLRQIERRLANGY